MPRGYERVTGEDNDDAILNQAPTPVPDSPPPSFRSRNSSRRQSRDETCTNQSEEERNLNNAFDAPSDDESDSEEISGDRRRLIQSNRTPSYTSAPESQEHSVGNTDRPTPPNRTVTQIPVFTPTRGGASSSAPANDGVFSNISAKPRPNDDVEEKPPTYEQAAADATPPYWETSVFSPYHTTGNPDDVFVDGLLVGSMFSFVWNALISMSFQLIGFLLTYLLHTTHAAKHGSRAGLGITLVQYGFQMRFSSSTPLDSSNPSGGEGDKGSPSNGGVPDNPNEHNFDPDDVPGTGGGSHDVSSGLSSTDWISYALMIVGWFIMIRAASDMWRARRQEALIRSSPDRGLGVAVVAEGERPESAV